MVATVGRGSPLSDLTTNLLNMDKDANEKVSDEIEVSLGRPPEPHEVANAATAFMLIKKLTARVEALEKKVV